ncbi:MAG: tyrosine-protein phosphatase [Bacteroidaceae bacterium]|nr:tyrosine-protein phosphatase [Bacteroidaceae bacterium]
MKTRELNLRDLGGIPLPEGNGFLPAGRYLRSGKLSVLRKDECEKLCQRYHIGCVIDLRTPIEAEEFPDPLPDGVEYVSIPLLKDKAVGITHETGSDPMTVLRKMRKNPEQIMELMPDFKKLYIDIVTSEDGKRQLDKVVNKLRRNEQDGICTLFHCTAGKDRTGIVTMALLKSYGISNHEIVKDYLITNHNAFWPTIKKCLVVAIFTRNWSVVKAAYHAFMADKELIETAIRYYDQTR